MLRLLHCRTLRFGDISASSRHWEKDIISPEVTLEGGKVMVPQSVDTEYEVDHGRLAEITKQRIVLER